MLELETNKGMFIGYVNLYKHMKENNINEIEIISISYYSKHLEFIRDNASTLYKSFFQPFKGNAIRIYTFEEIKQIVY